MNIPRYWRVGGGLGGAFHFVILHRVADTDGFGARRLEPIMGCGRVDGTSVMQLARLLLGSDIILAVRDAFAEEPDNRPGGPVRLRPGAMG
jgi:hypothetical protein